MQEISYISKHYNYQENIVKKDIFIEDGLHMNAKGYKGWTNQLRPIIERLYEPRTLR